MFLPYCIENIQQTYTDTHNNKQCASLRLLHTISACELLEFLRHDSLGERQPASLRILRKFCSGFNSAIDGLSKLLELLFGEGPEGCREAFVYTQSQVPLLPAYAPQLKLMLGLEPVAGIHLEVRELLAQGDELRASRLTMVVACYLAKSASFL